MIILLCWLGDCVRGPATAYVLSYFLVLFHNILILVAGGAQQPQFSTARGTGQSSGACRSLALSLCIVYVCVCYMCISSVCLCYMSIPYVFVYRVCVFTLVSSACLLTIGADGPLYTNIVHTYESERERTRERERAKRRNLHQKKKNKKTSANTHQKMTSTR